MRWLSPESRCERRFASLSCVYHVELRQFPHNFCRFNLTEGELRERILESWARGEWIEQGERKWSPHQANLTVLEGPRLPVEQLSMGRGWRNAVRQSKNVTEVVLEAVRSGASAHGGTHGQPVGVSPQPLGSAERDRSVEEGSPSNHVDNVDATHDMLLAADSLGLEVLAQLGEETKPLASAWRLARGRYPERAASDCLKVAEYAIRSLAQAQLVVVLIENHAGGLEPCRPGEQLEQALLAIDSWTGTGLAVTLRRV
jgi:hypothetical protein